MIRPWHCLAAQDQRRILGTFDTPENRYYKALLIKATYRNIRALSKADASGDENANRFLRGQVLRVHPSRLKAMERKEGRIDPSLALPGRVADAGARPPRLDGPPQASAMYSRFDKLCRLLNGGLSFAGDIVPIGMKETSLLYEYWCFLKIVELLRVRFDLAEQTVVAYKRLRMTVALQRASSRPCASSILRRGPTCS